MVSSEIPYGTYDSSIDEKGRVVIPAPLREYYGGTLRVIQGKPKCLWVMAEQYWLAFKEILAGSYTRLTPEEHQYNMRRHIYTAREVTIDKNSGRIPLYSLVREWAGLTKNCMIVSKDDRLEIWDTADFYGYLDAEPEIDRFGTNKIGPEFYNVKLRGGEAV